MALGKAEDKENERKWGGVWHQSERKRKEEEEEEHTASERADPTGTPATKVIRVSVGSPLS